MSTPPPGHSTTRRRHRSHQREQILDWLRATDAHPTAAQIHGALEQLLPHLSLGTVYRNLEVLVAEGEVDEVLAAGGPARYDANLEPHHHFICSACGGIVDVAISVPRGLAKRLAREHGLEADRVQLSFHGRCPACGPERADPETETF